MPTSSRPEVSLEFEIRDIPDKNKLPSPSFRHAAPSAPWPWVDIDDGINDDQMSLMNGGAPPIPKLCNHKQCNNCWTGYLKSRFPNWTDAQVKKSKIAEAIAQKPVKDCISYYVDVDRDGYFRNAEKFVTRPGKEETAWKNIVDMERPKWSKTRAIFIENLSGPILQMLGTRYNIEPFFFSSSLNWIPSRFQADLQPGIDDTLTITLTFLRSVSMQRMPDYKAATRPPSGQCNCSRDSVSSAQSTFHASIDAKAPLKLRYSGQHLCLDLFSVHVIRNKDGNTIISYHSDLDLPSTGAKELHGKTRLAGQSVYWQKMFQESSDPTLLLLTFLWHMIYSWDEALQHLYDDICQLESQYMHTGRWQMTQDLHIIRAHQLYYESLLGDFRNVVEFIRKHKNPAMTSDSIDSRDKELRMLEDAGRALKNVMNLVFCSVNITDSDMMRKMTEAATRDSAAMKQIAYLTMVFLPASFVAAIFGMNTREINPGSNGTLPHYVAFAVPLTILTIWVIVAFQSRYILREIPFWGRLAWPWIMLKYWLSGKRALEAQKKRNEDRTIEQDYGVSKGGYQNDP